mmetsp:Transcript_75582/g.133494  ORF Transcript_75582/g.133494 Transcript_75582/m.133494 type:complete len:199 (+) Transcript_75582:1116-1712(+)
MAWHEWVGNRTALHCTVHTTQAVLTPAEGVGAWQRRASAPGVRPGVGLGVGLESGSFLAALQTVAADQLPHGDIEAQVEGREAHVAPLDVVVRAPDLDPVHSGDEEQQKATHGDRQQGPVSDLEQGTQPVNLISGCDTNRPEDDGVRSQQEQQNACVEHLHRPQLGVGRLDGHLEVCQVFLHYTLGNRHWSTPFMVTH